MGDIICTPNPKHMPPCSYLLVQLLVHQKVGLGPAAQEPHNVFPHLGTEKRGQAGPGGPRLHLRRPQYGRQKPGGEDGEDKRRKRVEGSE